MLGITVAVMFVLVMAWALKAARRRVDVVLGCLPIPMFVASAVAIPRVLPGIAGLLAATGGELLCVLAAAWVGNHFRAKAMQAVIDGEC